MDETELLLKLVQGGQKAFYNFYKIFAPRVFRYALAILRDRYLAEEVVQETMITVWKGAKSFRGQSQVSTWIFGIARNHALRLLRRKPKSLPAEVHPEPEDLDQEERVRKALEKLPRIEREVVVLAFYQGLLYREITEILGIPEGTVKSRMFQAKHRLRKLLALGEGDPNTPKTSRENKVEEGKP